MFIYKSSQKSTHNEQKQALERVNRSNTPARGQPRQNQQVQGHQQPPKIPERKIPSKDVLEKRILNRKQYNKEMSAICELHVAAHEKLKELRKKQSEKQAYEHAKQKKYINSQFITSESDFKEQGVAEWRRNKELIYDIKKKYERRCCKLEIKYALKLYKLKMKHRENLHNSMIKNTPDSQKLKPYKKQLQKYLKELQKQIKIEERLQPLIRKKIKIVKVNGGTNSQIQQVIQQDSQQLQQIKQEQQNNSQQFNQQHQQQEQSLSQQSRHSSPSQTNIFEYVYNAQTHCNNCQALPKCLQQICSCSLENNIWNKEIIYPIIIPQRIINQDQ